MDKEQAIHNFWSSFGLKAYDEATVSESAQLPYITYNVMTAGLDDTVLLNASLWYRSSSWVDITKKADDISRDIGYSGKILKYDDGALWIVRGTPFAQRMTDEDTTIRRIFINVLAEFITAI